MQFSFSKKSSRPTPIPPSFGFGAADEAHGDGKPPPVTVTIIPPIPNERRLQQRMKKAADPDAGDDDPRTEPQEPRRSAPPEVHRLIEDLKDLGDDPGYEDMPVEGFGAALLAGYGWQEGRGVGRNAKEGVKVRQFSRGAAKGGLGYEPDKKVPPRSEEAKRESSDGSGNVRWLTSHIRVRVISKDLKRGRLYGKSGKVVDVVGPTSCDLLMDEDGELIQGVDQVLLETALPNRGGPVLVVSGRHKGVHGSLVERDLDQDTAIVRDADTHELFNVQLEQVAEFVEDPSLIGY